MLHENAIPDPNDVCRNPVYRLSKARKSPVHNYELSVSNDGSWFVPQGRRNALDETKQTLAPRFDVRAVLDVLGGPKALRCLVIPSVEQRIERLEYECLVLFWRGLGRVVLRLREFIRPNAPSR